MAADSDEAHGASNVPENEKKFVIFAEKHRAVLNQILRQSNVALSDGPFAVLTKATRGQPYVFFFEKCFLKGCLSA